MKTFYVTLLLVGCACAYPYYPYYTQNLDAVSVGGDRGAPNAMVFSRYYQPFEAYRPALPRGLNGGMAAFVYGDRSGSGTGSSGYMAPAEEQQTQQYLPPQETFSPPQPETIRRPAAVTQAPPELDDATDKTEYVTSRVTPTAELITDLEELEEVTQKPTPKPSKRRLAKKKQEPKVEEDDLDEEYVPKMPMSAYFPMFFGSYPGQRAGGGGGAPGGATAIANAYSTGRGGVATSHATAYGAPRPETHR